MRAQWIADMKAKGVQLQGYGKRYTTAFGATVGLAPANELDGHPNKWFLGMADEPTDVIVLLCRSRSGTVYDLVLPVPALGRCWALLSRSGSQVKFNVRKDVTVFLLLVPGNEPLDVTQYLSHYEPLGISRPKPVNSALATNSSPAREPSMTTFGRKKYSVQGVYEMIVSNWGEMYLNDIYRDIERSGELTVHDEDDNITGATRYKHNVRGYLQQLKRDGRVENVRQGLWRAYTQ